MSKKDDSKKQLKDVTNQAGEFAKSIWLAGLGAYGRAFDEAQGRYELASKEPPRLFEELVKKGERLESQARNKIGEVADIGKSISIEERISRMRASLGFGHSASVEDVQRLEKKLDALARKVDALSKGSATTTKKAPAKRSTAKKTSASKA